MFESITLLLIEDGPSTGEQLRRLVTGVVARAHVADVVVITNSTQLTDFDYAETPGKQPHWVISDEPNRDWRVDPQVVGLLKRLGSDRVATLSLSAALRLDSGQLEAQLRAAEAFPVEVKHWSKHVADVVSSVNRSSVSVCHSLARVLPWVSGVIGRASSESMQFAGFVARGLLVATCLVAISAATLGLLLPSQKSLAIAANAPEENTPTPTRLVPEPGSVSDLAKPTPTRTSTSTKPLAPAAVPEPEKVGNRPLPLRAWQPLALDRSDSSIDQRLKDSTTYLASDELEGRGVRTQGIDLAADYIAREFQKTGLQTDLVHGQPFQEFDLYSLGRERVVQEMQVRHGDSKHELVLDRDFTSLMAANSGVPFDLEVVFAGYGISSVADRYDDYEPVDVAGKAVVILRNLPPHLVKSGTAAQLVYLRAKVLAAVAHRAAAIIFCTDNADLQAQQGEPTAETLLRVELTNDLVETTIPIVHCQRSVLVDVCQKAGFDLVEAEAQIRKASAPNSQLLERVVLHGRSGQTRVGRKLKNVLAALPAVGEKAEQTIVVGAHYDHLGRGGYGSLSFSGERDIHNGADDNASGTAILLEIARQISARKEPLSRRVLFAAFSGEELGLVGSKRYVRDPVVPLSQTVAMLNLDMVGRLRDDKLTIYGTETSPMWPVLLDSAPTIKTFNVARRAGGFGPSDHASFYEKGIPVLHFFTGFHPQYHRPGDDAELLNIEGMRQITKLVVDLVVELADPQLQPSHRATRAPQLTDVSSALLDEVLSGKAPQRRPSMLGVVLGPIPNGVGLIIERTLPGSLAARSGIRVGDVIQELDGATVKTSDEMVSKVRSKQPDDVMTVLLVRNGVKLELKVRF